MQRYLLAIVYQTTMIIWQYPALGGLEFVLHHLLSMSSIFFSLVSGQAQFYILMVLFTESTTPFINLRWYLDATGQNNSRLYTFNVAVLFLVTNDLSLLSWLIAVDLYIRELDNFRFELSMNSCNDRLSKTHP